MLKKNETISAYLHRRLTELFGQHNRISQETGVPQSTLNRIYLGGGSPRLDSVQPLLDWIAAYDKLNARRRRRSTARPGSAGNGVLIRRRATRTATPALR